MLSLKANIQYKYFGIVIEIGELIIITILCSSSLSIHHLVTMRLQRNLCSDRVMTLVPHAIFFHIIANCEMIMC